MQTIEYVLMLTALLGVLGMLVQPIHTMDEKLASTQKNLTRHEMELNCSARAEDARTRFLILDANGCMNYSYTLHPAPNPFTITLQGEGHYE